MKLQLSVTTHRRYKIKQEKWITEVATDEIPLTCKKRPFSRSLCKFLFIYLTVTANFLLSAVKWSKILVLAADLVPHNRECFRIYIYIYIYIYI